MNKTLTVEKIDALKQAALAATPQDIDSAQSIDHYNDGRYIECPCCSGEGSVELEADFLNYDGEPLGVQFYGIGNAPGAAEAYFRAANPATILALLERLEHAEAALLAAQQPEPRAEVTEAMVDAAIEALGPCVGSCGEASPPQRCDIRDAIEAALNVRAGEGQ
ncbi:hypothetical protein [Burkholderia metallica]|uniref:hypothetical protein n=1 Tax=Burkholderia metallica TaxID=488729 RepID=UPI00084213C4|nr:hypothetical protein [Burkholderia metallica]AOJ31390.1 hypothetical protein WJ16_07635 [Burkholderia metallica]